MILWEYQTCLEELRYNNLNVPRKHEEAISYMLPNQRDVLKKAAEREVRVRRRAEQKEKAENAPKKSSSSGVRSVPLEDSRIPTQLFQNSPEEYLDLAVGSSVPQHSPYKSRAVRSGSSSGTKENPTTSRPKIVDLRRKGETSSQINRSGSPQSFTNPIFEGNRKSVGELVQQFSPNSDSSRIIPSQSQSQLKKPGVLQLPVIQSVPQVLPQGQIVSTIVMATTKLKYTPFRGKSQDADDWLIEFLDTAQTNKEDQPPDLLRLFQGLMKKDAMHWYHDLTQAIRGDWDLLAAAFLDAFRRDKSMSNVLAKLRGMKMKEGESVRSYGQRVRRLIGKIDPPLSAEMQTEYFIAGLPREMNKWVRREKASTMSDAIKEAQRYVTVEKAQDNVLKKEEREERRRNLKKKKKGKSKSHKKKKKNRRDSSDDSDSESAVSEDSAWEFSSESSISSSSSEDIAPKKRIHKKVFQAKEENKKIVGFQRTIDDLAGKFDKLAVHLADNKPKRRAVPIQRPGVWCARCGKRGHYPSECWENVQYVNEGDDIEVYSGEEQEVDWQLVAATPSYPTPPNLLMRPQGIGRGTGPMATRPIIRPPMGPPGGYPDPNKPAVRGTCYNCGDPSHYMPSCPYPRAPKPMQILCGNCGQGGHTPLECPNPAQPKLLVKYVKDPEPKDPNVRLIYIEEGQHEDTQHCEEIEFVEGEVFKTSTRSMKQQEYQDLREQMAKKKSLSNPLKKLKANDPEDMPGGKQKEGIPKELDKAYDRYDPKYFLKDISQETKDILQEELKDQQAKPTQPPKTVKFNMEGIKVDGKVGYDIAQDVAQSKANVTIGELLKENSFYRKQLRPLLTGRKRKYKLPSTLVNLAREEVEDLGAPDIEVQVAGCLIRKVPVDGGSGVNILIADTARALGFLKFETTPKVLRMADQSRVVPIGKLSNISVIIGDKPFRLNFLILDPVTPSTFPMLLGRPWLYKARVHTSWGEKTFTFGHPKTKISWETIIHQGETSSTDEGYTSEDSTSTMDSQWVYQAKQYEEADFQWDPEVNFFEVCSQHSESDSEDLSLLSLFEGEAEEQSATALQCPSAITLHLQSATALSSPNKADNNQENEGQEAEPFREAQPEEEEEMIGSKQLK